MGGSEKYTNMSNSSSIIAYDGCMKAVATQRLGRVEEYPSAEHGGMDCAGIYNYWVTKITKITGWIITQRERQKIRWVDEIRMFARTR